VATKWKFFCISKVNLTSGEAHSSIIVMCHRVLALRVSLASTAEHMIGANKKEIARVASLVWRKDSLDYVCSLSLKTCRGPVWDYRIFVQQVTQSQYEANQVACISRLVTQIT
jgi:hypothetical protein